jgi:hypothetical protein
MRATEVMMKRSSTLNWKYLSGLELNLIRIPEPPTKPDTPTGLELAQAIRTDLDHFTNLEVEELIQSGYRAAQTALANQNWIAANTPGMTWRPVPPSNLSLAERATKLGKSRFRRWKPLFFAFKDWAWWILFAILLYLLHFIV